MPRTAQQILSDYVQAMQSGYQQAAPNLSWCNLTDSRVFPAEYFYAEYTGSSEAAQVREFVVTRQPIGLQLLYDADRQRLALRGEPVDGVRYLFVYDEPTNVLYVPKRRASKLMAELKELAAQQGWQLQVVNRLPRGRFDTIHFYPWRVPDDSPLLAKFNVYVDGSARCYSESTTVFDGWGDEDEPDYDD